MSNFFNLKKAYYMQNQFGTRIPAMLGYVTDGLIAMWDGEYNAGNRHDPNATSWKDCVGGIVLPYVGLETYEWLDKCCHFLGTSGYGAFYMSLPDAPVQIGSLELCGSMESITGSSNSSTSANRIWYNKILIRTGKLSASQLSSVFRNNTYQRNGSTSLSFNNNYTCSLVQTGQTSSSFLMYRNAKTENASYSGSDAELVPSISIGPDYRSQSATPQGGAARVYCVRYYNRALTSAELEQNYAVDSARFGTTYQP